MKSAQGVMTPNLDKEKNFMHLYGILKGIVADKVLKDEEILYLDTWLKDQKSDDGDVIDLLDVIADVMEDGVITSEERQDLMASINTVIDCRDWSKSVLYERTPEQQAVDELLGLLSGIVVDNEIHEQELNQLLQHYDSIAFIKNGVFSKLYNLLDSNRKSIDAGKPISKQFHDQLIQVVQDLSGTSTIFISS